MKDILSLTLDKLNEQMQELGEKNFRAKQIYTWLHKEKKANFDEMTNLSKELREKLKNSFYIPIPKVFERTSESTNKYLLKFDESTIIESVLMKYSYGISLCVSTQAGCRMGCGFCASHVDGFVRDLTAGEILAQVYNTEGVSNIVIMGIGEPLENYENTVDFIKIISSKEGQDLRQRGITLSTCGLVDKIYRLADEKLQITLAISLHAPNDEIRKKIMPIAKKNTMDELLKASKYYFEQTGRRISFEYALIKDVNDSEDNAKELATLLKSTKMPFHVNVIELNPVAESEFLPSSKKNIFLQTLKNNKVEATLRKSQGKGIDAACGQLRNGQEVI